MPLEVDRSTTFESVGGLDGHLASLKEMVQLPLMYPEVFKGQFQLQPPSGVLFYGPPGTGKTMGEKEEPSKSQKERERH